MGTEPTPSLTLELVGAYGKSDLYHLLDEKQRGVTTVHLGDLIVGVAQQLCEALSFLQWCKIVHGDMKCENLLYTRSYDIKVIDFGNAALVGQRMDWPGDLNVPREMRGTRKPACFSQDLFGVGFVVMQFEAVDIRGDCQTMPDGVTATRKSLMNSAIARMTLEKLKVEPWIVPRTPPMKPSRKSWSSTSTGSPRPSLASLAEIGTSSACTGGSF